MKARGTSALLVQNSGVSPDKIMKGGGGDTASRQTGQGGSNSFTKGGG